MDRILELETHEKISIRHLSKSDVEGVWNNFNEVVEEGVYLPVFFPVRSQLEKESWYLKIKNEKELCIIAENLNLKAPYNIIGQCEISNSEWDAGLHVGILGIIVKNKYRDFGIGANLIDMAIRESKKLNNKEKIVLSCFSTNERALHLYKNLGFQIAGTRKKQYYMDSQYYDEVLMELWIDDYLSQNE
ncbi:MAG: N-acetyltransferase family protein [Promethearchaeota archaeon]|jgi:ribosomal protein S18 acetylase RimI-like enzyme